VVSWSITNILVNSTEPWEVNQKLQGVPLMLVTAENDLVDSTRHSSDQIHVVAKPKDRPSTDERY